MPSEAKGDDIPVIRVEKCSNRSLTDDLLATGVGMPFGCPVMQVAAAALRRTGSSSQPSQETTQRNRREQALACCCQVTLLA